MSRELYHWGIPGMKWRQRRYQNKDGSLTALGREHYGVGEPREQKNTPRTIEEETADLKKQAEYLRARNSLIQEKMNYDKLMASQIPQKEVSAGKKFVKNTMSRVGDKALSVLIDTGSKVAQKQAEDWLKSKGIMAADKKEVNITETWQPDEHGNLVKKSEIRKRVDKI